MPKQDSTIEETITVEDTNGDLTKKLVAAAVAFGFAAIAAGAAAFAQAKRIKTVETVEIIAVDNEPTKKISTKTTTAGPSGGAAKKADK